MLYRKSDLLENNTDYIGKDTSVYEAYGIDIFLNGLEYVLEGNEKVAHVFESAYSKAISAYGGSTSFREAFNNNFDLVSVIQSIFDAHIDTVSKIYNDGMDATTKALKYIPYLKNYKTAIKDENEDVDISAVSNRKWYMLKPEFEHYIYTNLDALVPPRGSESKIKEYFECIQDDVDSSLSDANSIGSIENLKRINNNVSGIKAERYLDSIRAFSLGKYNKIRKEDYDTELFRYFHNDSTEPDGSTVTPKEIKECYDRYMNGKSILSRESKNFNRMISDINSTKSKIITIGENTLRLAKDSNQKYLIGIILNSACGVCLDMCDIYSLSYAYKWDSIKNSYADDSRILLSVVYDVLEKRKKGEL